MTSIDPTQYEAARVDGAGYTKQMWYITLPSILPMILLVTVLGMGNILNAGFDQVFNLYSPIVYEKADIIDTFVYRIGMEYSSTVFLQPLACLNRLFHLF